MKVAALLRRHFGMPLLAKELIEQAARKRTYIIRTVYAVTLFTISCFVMDDWLRSQARDTFNILGRGDDLLAVLVALQIAGIYIFLPPLMSGAITQEKERDSLVLLMVTDLRPWQILMQKYLGRLIPMFSFLLLSLPLMAVLYAFGGIGPEDIAISAWSLTWSCLQVGAICLLVSAYARTTGAAFIGCYLFGAVFYLAPVTFFGILWMLGVRLPFNDDYLGVHIPFYPLLDSRGPEPMASYIIVPITTVALLMAARVVLVRRAFAQPKNLVLNIFRWLDRFYQRINYLAGDAVLFQSADTLPDNDPIAWREVNSRALGKPLYLFRILMALMVPVLLVGAIMLASHNYRHSSAEPVSALLFILWVITALLLSVQGASTFAADRSKQTLDVLLTLPITGTELVRQKAAALRRLGAVLLVPFVTLIGLETWWEYGGRWGNSGNRDTVFLYLTCSALALLVYLPLVTWLSMWIGMKIKSQARAIITSVTALVGWCGAPFGLIAMAMEFDWISRRHFSEWWLLASPASIIPFNEFAAMNEFGSPWIAMIVNFGFYGMVALWLRHLCLRRADRYLGRVV